MIIVYVMFYLGAFPTETTANMITTCLVSKFLITFLGASILPKHRFETQEKIVLTKYAA